MDEFVRRKGLWIGLAVLGIISLCVVMCIAAAFLALRPRETVTYAPVPYVAPQAGEEGAAPPTYQAPIVTRHGGLGLPGIVRCGLRLFFLGLLLLLGLRLLGHLLWGPRHCWAPYHCKAPYSGRAPYWGPRHGWASYHQGQPPSGTPSEPPAQGQGEAGWDPPSWARGPWRHPHHHWGPPPWWGPAPGQAGKEEKPAAGDAEYTGPQE